MEKDNLNANVDFVRGQADMIVLSALSDKDKYGLEILNAIQDRSQGMYSLKQATLYSSLKRLEKNGYVQSYDGDISNGAKRVYYGLTKQGRDHLNNDKSYWEFCNFLMSNLISDNKFDPLNEEKPFDPAEFRPLTRRTKSEKEPEKEVIIKYVEVVRTPEEVALREINDNNALHYIATDKPDEDCAILRDIDSDDVILLDDQSVASVDSQQEVAEVLQDIEETDGQQENIIIDEIIDKEESQIEIDDNVIEDVCDNQDSPDAADSQQESESQTEDVVQPREDNEAYENAFRSEYYFDNNNEINYVSSFSDLFNNEEPAAPEDNSEYEYLTLKEMVYKFQAKGLSIRPYEKKNTMEFYINRYYFSNKIHLHAALIIFAIFAVELIFSHLICNRVEDKVPAWALILGIVGVGIYPIIRAVAYLIDPTKKNLATFNPKSTLLISLLPVITLPIVFALMAFVQFGANINDYASMERTIILPSILLFNIPLYFLIFTLLYRTYKYHVN